MMLTIAPMTPSHLDAVMRIQADCYPSHMQEDRELVAARLAAAPGQCWIAQDQDGLCGYLFGYLSRRGRVTPLDGAFAPHPQPDCLYLHDLAVAPQATGRQIGRRLVDAALAGPRPPAVRWSALVSVQDSNTFWERLGYRSRTLIAPEQAAHLASYDVPARYMERTLA